MRAVELVGLRCVSTFVDRGGATVLQFEGEAVTGSGPTRRVGHVLREIRIPDLEVQPCGRITSSDDE